jgi:hypothetical protein
MICLNKTSGSLELEDLSRRTVEQLSRARRKIKYQKSKCKM